MLLSWEQNPLRAELELLKDETSVLNNTYVASAGTIPQFSLSDPFTKTKGCTFSVPSRSPQRRQTPLTVKHTFIPEGRRRSALLFFFLFLFLSCFNSPSMWTAETLQCFSKHTVMQSLQLAEGRQAETQTRRPNNTHTHTHTHSHSHTHARRPQTLNRMLSSCGRMSSVAGG